MQVKEVNIAKPREICYDEAKGGEDDDQRIPTGRIVAVGRSLPVRLCCVFDGPPAVLCAGGAAGPPAFALAWSAAELLFYCFAYRILYPKGAWFVYEKKLTFNPGAKRWFLPLYLALWSFTAVAAGITWYYGQPGILAVAAAQLGMILGLWLKLR